MIIPDDSHGLHTGTHVVDRLILSIFLRQSTLWTRGFQSLNKSTPDTADSQVSEAGASAAGRSDISASMAATASVDPQEIEKFNQLAATWWNASGPMWPLHTLNGLRSDYIVQHLVAHFKLNQQDAQPLAGLRILDIGCGGGLLSEAMAKQGADVHGVDISDGNIAAATLHAQSMSQPPHYEHTTAEALYQRAESYDVVLNMEVVEHVADLSSFMRTVGGLIRPGGLQFVSTINRNPLSWFSAIIGAEYILKWLPKGTHQYHKLVKPTELAKLLARDKLSMVATTGVFVNPVTRQMSLSRSRLINYMIIAEKRASEYLGAE